MDKELIAAVYNSEALWNPANHLHKNAVVLKKLWEEIAFELQKDVKILKARWKNLRAYFFKEHKKNEKMKSDGADKITSTWQYYNELMFLKGFPVKTDKDSNLGDENCDFMKIETLFEEQEDSVQSNSCSDTISRNAAETFNPASTSYDYSQPTRKKIRLNNQSEDNLVQDQKKLETLESENNKERNSDSLFFDSLLPYMANIPLARKLRLRSKIQDLIVAEIETEGNITQNSFQIQEVCRSDA